MRSGDEKMKKIITEKAKLTYFEVIHFVLYGHTFTVRYM